MKDALNFIRGKLNLENLKIHYLRVGKASPILDQLNELGNEKLVVFEQFEANSFADYHFGGSYMDYDAAIINLGVTDENITQMRREFWEEFIWKTTQSPLLVAIIYPDTNSFGSLSKSQLIEALSLVRMTDRPFELFEHSPSVAEEVFNWITSLSSVIHRIERVEEEEIE